MKHDGSKKGNKQRRMNKLCYALAGSDLCNPVAPNQKLLEPLIILNFPIKTTISISFNYHSYIMIELFFFFENHHDRAFNEQKYKNPSDKGFEKDKLPRKIIKERVP